MESEKEQVLGTILHWMAVARMMQSKVQRDKHLCPICRSATSCDDCVITRYSGKCCADHEAYMKYADCYGRRDFEGAAKAAEEMAKEIAFVAKREGVLDG